MNFQVKYCSIRPRTSYERVNRCITCLRTEGTPCGLTNIHVSITENNFKTRYNNHKLSFNDRKRCHAMLLSKHIWELKDSNSSYILKWRIIKRANAHGGTLPAEPMLIRENLHFIQPYRFSTKQSELIS